MTTQPYTSPFIVANAMTVGDGAGTAGAQWEQG